MKRVLIKGLILILTVLILGAMAVSCEQADNKDGVNIEEADIGARKLKLAPGKSLEVVLADYVNENGLDGITYELQSGDSAITLTPVTDGKFTVTASDVGERDGITVTITVFHNGEERLKVELSVQITNDITDYSPEYVPDDNVDHDW